MCITTTRFPRYLFTMLVECMGHICRSTYPGNVYSQWPIHARLKVWHHHECHNTNYATHVCCCCCYCFVVPWMQICATSMHACMLLLLLYFCCARMQICATRMHAYRCCYCFVVPRMQICASCFCCFVVPECRFAPLTNYRPVGGKNQHSGHKIATTATITCMHA